MRQFSAILSFSCTGVAICTFYAALINHLHGSGHLPTNLAPSFFVYDDSPVPITVLFGGIVLMYIWGDFHFYWTHRLLHTQMLYKAVHKVHHQSFNPDPFSGLSMHWFESAIYFSSGDRNQYIRPTLFPSRLLTKLQLPSWPCSLLCGCFVLSASG